MNALYIYELTIQSSYRKNTEIPATEDSFDTVQWWLCENMCWRIRTFDNDSDIHIHSIGQAMTIYQIEELMKRRYSDVLFGRYDFPEITINDNEVVVNKMKSGSLEVSKDKQFAFWNHDNRQYTSKSKPIDG